MTNTDEKNELFLNILKDPNTTPEMKERVIDITREQSINRRKDEKIRREWRSCCLIFDKDFCRFFTQLGILCATMTFCAIQLTKIHQGTDECNAKSNTYIGILTMCLGIIIPSPKLK